MNDRRTRRIQETKARIIDATIALFQDSELDAISIQSICDLADISRRSFYSYFPCKEAVIAEFVNNSMMAIIENEFNLAEDNYNTFKERLHYIVECAAERRENYTEIHRKAFKVAMVYEFSKYSANRRTQALKGNKDFFNRWILSAQEQGELTQEFSAEFLAKACSGVFFNINQHWMNNSDYPHIQRIHQAEVFLYKMLIK